MQPVFSGTSFQRVPTNRAERYGLHYLLRSEEDSADLACLLAESTQSGDTYLLKGPVGCGKSTFWCAPHTL